MANTVSLPEIIAGAIGGGGLSQLGIWVANRKKVRADTFGSIMETVTSRLEKTEERLDEVEDRHKECEVELRGVKERLDASERDRNELRNEIDRLMAGPVAGYRPGAPK